MKIGAQMFTVREYTQTPDDIANTFEKLANIGYSTVQVSAIGEIAPEKLNEIAIKNNIQIAVTHTNPLRILEQTQKVIDEHKIFDCKNIGIGAMPEKYLGGIDGIKSFLADYDNAAKLIAENGMKLHYHNHGFEFEKYDGVRGYDYMLENTLPQNWGFILDTYWVQYAGCDVVNYIEKMRGRIDIIHYKDMSITGYEQKMAAVMEGNMPFDKIIKASIDTNIAFAMVEQDDCYGENPFDMMALSYNNLKKAGL